MKTIRLFSFLTILSIFIPFRQNVYSGNEPQRIAETAKYALDISSDHAGKMLINEATPGDTVFIRFRIPGLTDLSSLHLFVNDTLMNEVEINDTIIQISIDLIENYIVKPSAPFKMVTFGVGKVKPESISKPFKMIYQPYSIVSVNKETVIEAEFGEQIWIRSELAADQVNVPVFLNDLPVPVAKLAKDKMIPGPRIYYFILRNKFSDFDSLSNYLKPDFRGSSKVKVSIGRSFETREELSDHLTITFDKYKVSRNWVSLIVFFFIVFIIIYLFKKNKLAFLRDSGSNIENRPFSLAKSQMAFWTLIILFAFIYIWFQTGSLIHITPQILILLGISATTTFAGNVIDKNDIADPKVVVRHQEKKKGSFLMDILSDNTGVGIHRFQNVVFTIAIGAYFLYEVFIHDTIPELDTNLMILMGISSATYIAVKNNENKAAQDKPVG